MTLTVETAGEPVQVSFRPELPLGADLREVTLAGDDGRSTGKQADLQRQSGEERALISFEARLGRTQCAVTYKGGVQIILPWSPPQQGQSSAQIRVGAVDLHDHTLALDTYTTGPQDEVLLKTDWIPVAGPGTEITKHGPGVFRIKPEAATSTTANSGYTRRKLVLNLKEH